MSIDKVEITNSQGDLLTLTLDDISNGYVVKEIGGLEPVKATIVTSNFATLDGQQFQSSSREVRNITFKLGYAPNFSIDQTIRTLRSGLYPFFMPGASISMVFYMTDGLTVNISGRVETFEAPLFAQDPESNISIVCFNPDFIETTMVEMHTTFTTGDTTPSAIDYEGSVPTGFTSIRFTAGLSLSEFSIYHTTPDGTLNTMIVSVPLILNDVVDICTIKGQKSITLTRGTTVSSILWAVSPESTWIQLQPGVNQFYLFASASAVHAVLVDYYNRYGGL